MIGGKARGNETTRVGNIKLGFGEIEWGGVDWIGPAQDRNK